MHAARVEPRRDPRERNGGSPPAVVGLLALRVVPASVLRVVVVAEAVDAHGRRIRRRREVLDRLDGGPAHEGPVDALLCRDEERRREPGRMSERLRVSVESASSRELEHVVDAVEARPGERGAEVGRHEHGLADAHRLGVEIELAYAELQRPAGVGLLAAALPDVDRRRPRPSKATTWPLSLSRATMNVSFAPNRSTSPTSPRSVDHALRFRPRDPRPGEGSKERPSGDHAVDESDARIVRELRDAPYGRAGSIFRGACREDSRRLGAGGGTRLKGRTSGERGRHGGTVGTSRRTARRRAMPDPERDSAGDDHRPCDRGDATPYAAQKPRNTQPGLLRGPRWLQPFDRRARRRRRFGRMPV